MATRSFTLTGEKESDLQLLSKEDLFETAEIYNIAPPSRDGTNTLSFDLEDNNMAEFHFSDGTIWLADNTTINDVFPELEKQQRDGKTVQAIPLHLSQTGTERGITDVILKLVKVFLPKKEEKDMLDDGISKLAATLEDKQLENKIGLFRLQSNFELKAGSITTSNKPYLLFIHGTASSTNGSFGKVYGSSEWEVLNTAYDGRILAFQHRTLTEDPFTNLLLLLEKLPGQCELHLVTHSRGGLVGDLLCRFCAKEPGNEAFTKEELGFWEKKASAYGYHTAVASVIALLSNKQIRVTKMVRVACPAAGTTLAGKRLEYFFNVTLNLLGTAVGHNANPVYVAFKNLITSIVKKKDDPDALPGLAAQNPDSAFIKVLNHANASSTVEAPLYVIAGNATPDLSFKALMVIVTRLFFIAKNDFVVNTSSMSNGSMRAENKTFWLLDEGAAVSHFNYFGNGKTRKAILNALNHVETSDDLPEGFVTVRQKLNEGELRQAKLGIEGGDVIYDSVSGEKPICMILPGIMGSNLYYKDRKIWISYWQMIGGQLANLKFDTEKNKYIKALSLIRTSYKALAKELSKDYDVLTFAFDWRLSMKENAATLAATIRQLLTLKQPIKIIGHSMGGVLVRDLMVFEHDTWKKLYDNAGFQLIFLGSPLGGSYRIPYVLFGFDAIIKLLCKLDLENTMNDLLKVFNRYPGLLGLLPYVRSDEFDFATTATWEKCRSMLGLPDTWPLPPKDMLDEFGKYRDTVMASSDKMFFKKAVYLAGRDKQTPAALVPNAIEPNRLEFMMTTDGDQSVTWDSGIPRQMIELGNVYYANISHGALANTGSLFPAIKELLHKGETELLTKQRPINRGSKLLPPLDPDTFDLSEDGIEETLLALGSSYTEPEIEMAKPLDIQVKHGDLKYATYPMMAGHFLNDGIFSVEKVIDYLLDGELNRRNKLGIYPGPIGTYDLILSSDRLKSFKGSLVIGLGVLGKLTAYELSRSVEKGIIKYLTVYNADKTRINFKTGKIGISTPAIGCGYGGLTVESSIRGILQGIHRANHLAKQHYGENALLLEEIEFIEIFDDRSLDYMYSLTRIGKEKDSGLHFKLSNLKIGTLLGKRKRIPLDDTDDWWTRISVRFKKEKDDDGKWQVTGIRYNMTTTTAREEEAEISINIALLQRMLEESSVENKWSENLARTIYELLIPNYFKEFLNKQSNIVWVVDTDTASLPWELLKHSQKISKPLSVSSGMIRQLATPNFRPVVNQVAARSALVVADPELMGFQPQLPGALQEGKAVGRILKKQEFETLVLENKKAADILVALFTNEYKVVHLAGHGIFNKDENKPNGMLIGKDAVLTPAEIEQMTSVPELVFINCCHLGAVDSGTEAMTQSRFRLAANLGTQLINIGVKAVVAAGWAVDDQAALAFAETFYDQMFSGDDFGNALRKAREAAYNHSGSRNNTWGAYQAYGDPFYTIDSNKHVAYGSKDFNFVVEGQVEMELYNLLSKHETGSYENKQIADPLDKIMADAEAKNLLSARSIELAAKIAGNLGDYANAIKLYQQLFGRGKSDYDIRAIEQYCNIRAKYAIHQLEGTNASNKKERDDAKNKARKELLQVTKELSSLISITANAERHSLLASTQKRLAIIQSPEAQSATLKQAAENYKKSLGFLKPGAQYYPLANWLTILAILALKNEVQWGKDNLPGKAVALQMLKEEMKICEVAARKTENYWDMVAVPNLMLTMTMLEAAEIEPDEIKFAYNTVWTNVGTPGDIRSEIEQFEFILKTIPKTNAPKQAKVNAIADAIKSLKENAENRLEEKEKK